MNTAMYDNPVTRRNIETLKEYGYIFIEPRDAMLACGTKGRGALAGVEVIVNAVKEKLEPEEAE